METTSSKKLLTPAQIDQFNADGFLMLKNFYDIETEITPILRDIHKIIGIIIAKEKLPIEQLPFAPETFDSGYQSLIAHNRRLGAVVYDAVKQIPAFVRLTASEKHDGLMQELRGTDLPAVAAGGYGIRIDNPFEEKFRANWHQDYPSQLRSLDGLVFWSPLVELTEDLGPLQIAVASHKKGLAPLWSRDPDNPEKTGAYALRLAHENETLAPYAKVQGLASPGDLLVIDYLNLHASGFNRGARSRWSMQMRYFNFREPTGQSYDWVGSFAAGKDIRTVHPGLILD